MMGHVISFGTYFKLNCFNQSLFRNRLTVELGLWQKNAHAQVSREIGYLGVFDRWLTHFLFLWVFLLLVLAELLIYSLSLLLSIIFYLFIHRADVLDKLLARQEFFFFEFFNCYFFYRVVASKEIKSLLWTFD